MDMVILLSKKIDAISEFTVIAGCHHIEILNSKLKYKTANAFFISVDRVDH